MFESSNIVFVLFAVAVIIVRTVLQAKKRQDSKAAPGKAPPQNAAPQRAAPKAAGTPHKISVHFEDDEPEYFKSKAPARSPEPAVKKKKAAGFDKYRSSPGKLKTGSAQDLKVPLSPPAAGIAMRESPAPAHIPQTHVVASGQKVFPLNLNNLSPLKQAVVMAEILGTPKGLL